MKIAYFLDIGFGGAGNLAIKRAALMSDVHDVTIVIPVDAEGNYNHECAVRCDQKRIPYTCIRYCTATDFNYDFTEHLQYAGQIETFAIQERIDFFHSVQLNVAAELISRKLKIPHVMDIYQLREEEFILCPGKLYPHYHLCDSQLYANRWSRKLELESRCSRPVAIAEHMGKKQEYPKNRLKLLMLGLICERKNQLSAIRAVEQCRSRFDIELHIAGDDSRAYAKECKAYIKKQGLETSIVLHGLVSNIIPLLESCDCLLCSSTDESFPSSMVEALTYDLTIISTPVAGVPELFHDRINSFISRDFSSESIAKAISDCFQYYQSGEINRIHKNAEKTWRDNFAQSTIRKQINIYYEYIKERQFFEPIDLFYGAERELEETKDLLHDIDQDQYSWIFRRCFYYTMVRKHFYEGKLYIWGAGEMGKLAVEILRRICPRLEITAFIDIAKKGVYCGFPIVSFEEIDMEDDSYFCISFMKDRDDAIQFLEEKGLVLYKQIFTVP